MSGFTSSSNTAVVAFCSLLQPVLILCGMPIHKYIAITQIDDKKSSNFITVDFSYQLLAFSNQLISLVFDNYYFLSQIKIH